MSTAGFAELLAGVRFSDAPEAVQRQVRLLLLDGLGCGLSAAREDWATRAVTALAPCDLGDAGELVWAHERQADPATAVLLNGSFIQGSELDDYNEFSPVHASSVVAPPALAAVAGSGSGTDFLDGLLAGYETAARVGRAMAGPKVVAAGWHSGGVFGPLAAAAAAGRALHLDNVSLEHALGIAATQAGGLMAAQYDGDVKRMHHGFAGRNGYVAAKLAATGVRGITGVFEYEYGGYASTFLQGLEHAQLNELTLDFGSTWRLMDIGVKFHACMIGLHSTIDGLRELRDRFGFTADDVTCVSVGLSESMHRRAAFDLPEKPGELAAQMNAAYAAAVTLLDGQAWLEQFEDPRRSAPDVTSLRRRVRVYHDAAIDKLGPQGRLSSSLAVELTDGRRFELASPAPSQRSPFLDSERVIEKFVGLVEPCLASHHAAELIDLVLELDQTMDAMGRLRGCLARCEGGKQNE